MIFILLLPDSPNIYIAALKLATVMSTPNITPPHLKSAIYTDDHFLDFVNRPYFYQDVALGTRKLRLNSGEKIMMPNVIQKLTRATMVKQKLQFCEEEQFEPLCRAALFQVLEIREGSQQQPLCGFDNMPADGSARFE